MRNVFGTFKTGLAILGLGFSLSGAATISYVPPIPDFNDLDHYYAYKWGINSTQLVGKKITGATLFIDNIRDWKVENNDVLYIRLLSSAPNGITQYYDNQATGDYFGSTGTQLVTYNDLGPYTEKELQDKKSQDKTYNFTASQLTTLMSYVTDGNFGLTFDPDCHYYNDGVKLTVTYEDLPPAVPEPGTLGLLGIGLLGAFYLRRKHS